MFMDDADHTFLSAKIMDNIRQQCHLIIFAGNVREQAAAMESINEDNKASVTLPTSENCSIPETDLKGGKNLL